MMCDTLLFARTETVITTPLYISPEIVIVMIVLAHRTPSLSPTRGTRSLLSASKTQAHSHAPPVACSSDFSTNRCIRHTQLTPAVRSLVSQPPIARGPCPNTDLRGSVGRHPLNYLSACPHTTSAQKKQGRPTAAVSHPLARTGTAGARNCRGVCESGVCACCVFTSVPQA